MYNRNIASILNLTFLTLTKHLQSAFGGSTFFQIQPELKLRQVGAGRRVGT